MSSRAIHWLMAAMLLVLWNDVPAHAVLLEFDIGERSNASRGPFNLVFTRGEVVLCEGGIKGRRDGCSDGVAMSDIITFTAVMQQGSSYELKSDKEATDVDRLPTGPDTADVEGPLKPVTDNVVYLAEPSAGTFTYTPADGEPGFIRLSDNTSTFNITSDVPLPPTWCLLLSGLVGTGAAVWRRKGYGTRRKRGKRATTTGRRIATTFCVVAAVAPLGFGPPAQAIVRTDQVVMNGTLQTDNAKVANTDWTGVGLIPFGPGTGCAPRCDPASA